VRDVRSRTSIGFSISVAVQQPNTRFSRIIFRASKKSSEATRVKYSPINTFASFLDLSRRRSSKTAFLILRLANLTSIGRTPPAVAPVIRCDSSMSEDFKFSCKSSLQLKTLNSAASPHYRAAAPSVPSHPCEPVVLPIVQLGPMNVVPLHQMFFSEYDVSGRPRIIETQSLQKPKSLRIIKSLRIRPGIIETQSFTKTQSLQYQLIFRSTKKLGKPFLIIVEYNL